MALQKIRFQTNVPLELSLKFTEGKLCDSQFGDPQYMFTTIDERVLFVAEKVAQKIHGMHLKPGEPIDVCKAEVDYGNGRKGIEWQIRRVGSPEGPQPDGTFAVPRVGASVPAPAPLAASSSPSPISQPSNNGNGSRHNGNGHAPVAPPVNPPVDIHTGWAQFLLEQTQLLVDVFAATSRYASMNHGNQVKAEDVRALLTTAFIGMGKNGGGPRAN
jgi:hypothetical protein